MSIHQSSALPRASRFLVGFMIVGLLVGCGAEAASAEPEETEAVATVAATSEPSQEPTPEATPEPTSEPTPTPVANCIDPDVLALITDGATWASLDPTQSMLVADALEAYDFGDIDPQAEDIITANIEALRDPERRGSDTFPLMVGAGEIPIVAC